MKVAIIGPPFGVGGTELHLARIIPQLEKRQIDIRTYEVFGNPIRDIFRLAKWIRKEKPDILHFFLPRAYVIGSIAAELVGHGCRVMSRRSLSRSYAPWWMWVLEKLLHSRTNYLVANSKAVYNELCKECGDISKVGLIHSGVEIPANYRTPTPIFTIATIGNLYPYKGHDDLLNAISLIKDRLPKPWRLLIVGRTVNQKWTNYLQSLAGTRVCFTGVKDSAQILAETDLFVLPSREEGFSNALLEAMVFGLPVIATRVGGNSDAVVNGQSGILVEPNDSTAMGMAIAGLANNPKQMKRLGIAARERVRTHFSLNDCANKYAATYDCLTSAANTITGNLDLARHQFIAGAEIKRLRQ